MGAQSSVAGTSAAVEKVNTARHLSVVVGAALTDTAEVSNLLGDTKAAYERMLGTIDDKAVRDISRFGEADLMRAIGAAQMESLTLTAALLGQGVMA